MSSPSTSSAASGSSTNKMTDTLPTTRQAAIERTKLIRAGLRRRHLSENIFKGLGLAAIVLALGFVALLFIDIIGKGAAGLHPGQSAPVGHLRSGHHQGRAGPGSRRRPVRCRFPRRQSQMAARSGAAQLEQGRRSLAARRSAGRLRNRQPRDPDHSRNRCPPRDRAKCSSPIRACSARRSRSTCSPRPMPTTGSRAISTAPWAMPSSSSPPRPAP